MASTLLSVVLIFLISITGIFIVLSIGNTLVDNTMAYSNINENKIVFDGINRAVNLVSSEGYSSRELSYNLPSQIEIFNKSRMIVSKIDSFSGFFEYGSRTFKNNIAYIGGSDVNCEEKDSNNDGTLDYLMENTYIKIGLQRINGVINTKDNILLINEKTSNNTVTLSNSSILINDNYSSSVGTGYSEMDLGANRPVCIAHFYVNSNASISYDIYYKLYAFADFVVIEVKNIY